MNKLAYMVGTDLDRRACARSLARTHALTRSLPLSLRALFALQDKCGYNYTAALGSEEALRGAVGASSAVRATALAGVAFFFAALV